MAWEWASFWERVKRFFDFAARRRELYRQWDREADNGDEEARYKLLMLYQDEGEEYYPWLLNGRWRWRMPARTAG